MLNQLNGSFALALSGNNTWGGNNYWGGGNTWGGNNWGGFDGFNGSSDLSEGEELGQLLSHILGQGFGNQQCGNGNDPFGFGGGERHHHRHHDEGCMPGAFPGCGGQQPPWAQSCGCHDGCGDNSQRPQSLAGTTVFGDPHAKGTNGQQVNDIGGSGGNAVFLNSNGAMVETEAPGGNQATQNVVAYAPGSRGINAAGNTPVYEQINGQITQVGTTASMGIGDNPYNTGVNIGSGQSFNIGGGVTVNNAGGGSVNFNQTA